MSATVDSMEAGDEPTGMNSRHVARVVTGWRQKYFSINTSKNTMQNNRETTKNITGFILI